jgi:uncharacterized protein YndB with AHSA1/START domain
MLILAERRHSMIEFQHRIDIEGSPSEVFALLADVERISVWQRSVIEVTKRTPGAVRTGTVVEETLRMMGRRRASVRVAAYTPVDLIAFAGDAGFVDYYCAFELTPTGSGGTTLIGRTEFRLHGLWKVLQPLMSVAIRRETAKELATFKRLVEAATVAAQPAPAN